MISRLIAAVSTPEGKGLFGVAASLTLADWSSAASIAAGLATTVYMARKTYLLRAAPVSANSND